MNGCPTIRSIRHEVVEYGESTKGPGSQERVRDLFRCDVQKFTYPDLVTQYELISIDEQSNGRRN